MEAERGVAPVVGAVLLVGVTVATAAAVGAVLSHGAADGIDDVAATAVGSSLSARPIDAGDQRLRLMYRAGPPLPVGRLTIRVVLPNGRSGRLVELPAGRGGRCYGEPDDVLRRRNVEGDAIFSRACGAASGAVTAKGGDGVWRPGEGATVRITVRDGGGADLEPGDVVRVAVIDDEADAVVERLRIPVE